MRAAAANGLWYVLGLPESVAFRRAVGDAAAAQRGVLARLLGRNAGTEYGRRYGFATIRSVADFRSRLPLTGYDDYREAVERIGAGRPGVLTRDRVRLLEPTSGSTAPTKLIPYTDALRAEFGRAIAPWIEDLYRHDPRLALGPAYWSVTPVARRRERTPGGIPIGFEEEGEYFGPLRRALVHATMAVPPLVRLIDELEAFRYVTLLFLLRCRELRLISIWNPTFLGVLVGRLGTWWPSLADDIAAGRLRPPAAIAPELLARLTALNRPAPRRAAEIRAAWRAGGEPGAIHARLWPRLRLISCWADSRAARDAPTLARLFPRTRLQGKGLIATEGIVSFPLHGRPGGALAIRSHFFEFLPAERAGEAPRLAHELEPGGRYAVVITTGGGLYRYRLHDLVEVVGRLGTCPLVRFLGKEAHVSDRFGEKLDERHVGRALDALLARHRLRPSFAMLACEEASDRPAYTLFVEAEGTSDETLRRLGRDLEAALQENYHYRYCRDLEQLGPVRVFRIDRDARETYLEACRQHGQRVGDVKSVALHRRSGWTRAFRGQLLGT